MADDSLCRLGFVFEAGDTLVSSSGLAATVLKEGSLNSPYLCGGNLFWSFSSSSVLQQLQQFLCFKAASAVHLFCNSYRNSFTLAISFADSSPVAGHQQQEYATQQNLSTDILCRLQ